VLVGNGVSVAVAVGDCTGQNGDSVPSTVVVWTELMTPAQLQSVVVDSIVSVTKLQVTGPAVEVGAGVVVGVGDGSVLLTGVVVDVISVV